MVVEHYSNAVKPKPPTITEAARSLGVHRVYLSSVLHGRMTSKRLMARIALQFPTLQRAAMRESLKKTNRPEGAPAGPERKMGR